MNRPQPQLPTRQEFSDALSAKFEIQAADGASAEFTLIECKSVISNEQQECYSLLFRGPVDQPPVQDTYLLKNDQLGNLQLLLVPVKRDANGLYFEAVMNHLVKQ